MDDILKYAQNKFLRIIVRPNAKKSEVISYDVGKEALKVAIAAPPEDNKANTEVMKFFKKLTKKKVSIVSGLKSKEKIIKFN